MRKITIFLPSLADQFRLYEEMKKMADDPFERGVLRKRFTQDGEIDDLLYTSQDAASLHEAFRMQAAQGQVLLNIITSELSAPVSRHGMDNETLVHLEEGILEDLDGLKIMRKYLEKFFPSLGN